MMKLFQLLGLLLVAFVFSACPIKNERLPKEILPVDLPALPTSIIQIPLVLKSKDLKQAFYEQFPNPVLKGETKEMKMKLHGKKKEEDKNILDRLASPLLKWVDKTFYVSSKIFYEVDLSNYDIWFEKNQFYADVLLDLRSNIQLKNAISVLGKNAKLDGNLNCPMQVRVVMNGAVNLTTDASIEILLDDNNARIKFQKVCSSNVMRDIDLPKLLKPVLEPLKKEMSKAVNKIITRQLQRLLNDTKHNNYLSFQEKIDVAAQQLGQPYELMKDIWLIPKVEQVFVSPINGVGGRGAKNQLEFSIGVKGKPVILLSEVKPQYTIPKTIKFAVENYQTKTSLYVNGRIPLSYAAHQLQTFLKVYIDQYYAEHGYTIGEVTIYPSGERAAVAVDVLKTKTMKTKATLYLSGIPKYDSEKQEVYLDEMAFTAESKNVILKFAEWIMHPKIMKELKTHTRFGLSAQLKELQQELNDFQLEEQMGTLKGGFDYVAINQVFVSAKDFEVYLKAKGKLEFDINW